MNSLFFELRRRAQASTASSCGAAGFETAPSPRSATAMVPARAAHAQPTRASGPISTRCSGRRLSWPWSGQPRAALTSAVGMGRALAAQSPSMRQASRRASAIATTGTRGVTAPRKTTCNGSQGGNARSSPVWRNRVIVQEKMCCRQPRQRDATPFCIAACSTARSVRAAPRAWWTA